MERFHIFLVLLELSFWQIHKILRYEKPYMVNFQPPIFAHFYPHFLNKLSGNVAPHVKCPMCSEMFYSEISMETHISITHAGQCIDCDECKQKFPNYGYLRLHKNIYHHRSDASFPLQSLSKMQSLTSPIQNIPLMPSSTASLPIIPPVQKLPKVESSKV